MPSPWPAIYTFLGSFKNLKDSKIPTLLVAVGSALAGHQFWPEDPQVSAPLSEARSQMLASGVVGKPVELNGKISAVISEHFAAKGFPCDPVTASPTVGETMERAKACAAPVIKPE